MIEDLEENTIEIRTAKTLLADHIKVNYHFCIDIYKIVEIN